MTREEAIKRLKEARNTIQPFRYVDEAIDYAIKALKQEPCDDAVSRQALLDEFKDGTEGYDWAKWTRIDIIDAIEALPPVVPKREHGEWIINEEDESVKCPSCGGEFYTWGISTERIKKCPNCGAEMR